MAEKPKKEEQNGDIYREKAEICKHWRSGATATALSKDFKPTNSLSRIARKSWIVLWLKSRVLSELSEVS